MQKSTRDEELIHTLGSCDDIGKDAAQYFENLQQLSEKIRNDKIFQANADILVALGNADRLLILQLLQKKDRCVCELEAALKKSQPAISRDLRILEQVHLIHGWKKGKFTHYSINKNQFEKVIDISKKWVGNISNTILIETRQA